MGVHERLDLDHWLNTFPLEGFVADHRTWCEKHARAFDPNWVPGGAIISSPRHLAKVEHTRRALTARGVELGPGDPVDIFLWRIGDTSKGPVTRIGGRPFRDPSVPWPTCERGQPIPFLAQISFLDSMDLVPRDLPGEVLGIYAPRAGQHYVATDQAFAFEWVKTDRGEDASTFQVVSDADWPFCAEGVIHRTANYPECYDQLLELDVDMPYTLNCYQATSIGRTAQFIQGEPSGLGRLVAVLNSLQAADDWPFINCAALPRFTYRKGHEGTLNLFEMMLCDAGCLYFYKNKKRRYECCESSY